MPLIINMLPHQGPAQGNKEIVMGKKEVADYYPPGATEPMVRPADVPAPKPEGVVVESESVGGAVEAAKESFHKDVVKPKRPVKNVPKKK